MNALLSLGHALRKSGYRFTTITPQSHARVNRRAGSAQARSLRDVFGWSRPFDPALLPAEISDDLSPWTVPAPGGLLRSTVRFSTYEDKIFMHSAFPTTGTDAVFFGPDTYRYLNLLRRLAPVARCAVDVGCGSGAGGIVMAGSCREVILTDINTKALQYSALNAELNGVSNVRVMASDVLRDVQGAIDLVISNPPYLIDEQSRLYRDGGGRFGERLSLEIVRQSLDRLEPGGRLILYTATAIVDGHDTFREALDRDPRPETRGQTHYEEIDPDVFGEELEGGSYGEVERLAVVALDITLHPTRQEICKISEA